jgi:transglutaminase-like putative cysteine protease
LFNSLDLLIKNQPVDDPLFFISVVTLIYWLIGLSAGYWIARHQSFLAVVLPSGLAILTVQAFDAVESKHIWELAFFIFVCLLLLGRIYFLQSHSFWKQTYFLLSDDAIKDIERGTLVITAIIVFISWSLPGWISGIKPAARAWREFSQPIFDKYSNAVSALDSPYAGENSGGDFYGDALALGQQAAAGNTPVFTVDVKDNTFVPVRNYWKGRVYDLYLNGRWTTGSNSSVFFLPATDELPLEYPNTRHQMEYTFTSSIKKQNLLYTPAETIWVSTRADIFSTHISAEVKDVNAWVATTSLSSGDKYRVRALIADPSIKELRSAGTKYPDWITGRYLQIPEDIAPQLNKLAMEITAPYDTVYDKVQAVTSYLRKEIKYETKITSTPPKNKDPVLWVLFGTKKGFCMYYASAETLMLRSIGIPARMAVGFVEGNYDELNWQYVVTYQDAHAWPEVYFPSIGWVEFEPTSSQFPLERPETKNANGAETTPAPNVTEDSEVNPQAPVPLQEQTELAANGNSSAADQAKLYAYVMITALIALTLNICIFIARRYSLNKRLPVYLATRYERHGNTQPRWLSRWTRWTNLSPIERAFQAVNLSLFWLGYPQPAHVTSQKRAEILIEYLPSAQDQTLLLLQEYHTAIYTPHAGNATTARKAAGILLLKTWKIRLKRNLIISR